MNWKFLTKAIPRREIIKTESIISIIANSANIQELSKMPDFSTEDKALKDERLEREKSLELLKPMSFTLLLNFLKIVF